MLHKRIVCVLLLLGLAVANGACVTYTGVTKDNTGQVYLTGETGFLIFGKPWVKRCVEKGEKLDCTELAELDEWDRPGAKPYR